MPVQNNGSTPLPYIARAMYETDPMDNMMIANQVGMPIHSMEQEGTVGTVSRKTLSGRGSDTRRAPGASFNRDQIEVDGTPFKVQGHGHEVPVPEEDRKKYANIMDALRVGAMSARSKILTDREIRVRDKVFDTAVWTGGDLFTDNSGSPWATAGTDIIGQVKDGLNKVRVSGVKANSMILSHNNFQHMVYTNTEIKALLSGLSVPTPDAIRRVILNLFEIDKIIVGEAVYNTANEGQDYVGGDIWTDTYVSFARTANTDRPEEPCFYRNVDWQAMGPGTDMSVRTYWENQTTSDIVQGSMHVDEVVVDPAMAHLMQVKA